MTSIYKQSDYGKCTLNDMLSVYNELEESGDSKNYLLDLANQLAKAVHAKNETAQFGIESALEVILMLMAAYGR